uniref:Uncharacterized protein n=1 Tax=Arundo donax TaxID=35708 RepID=A0A0A9BP48_ARUDO
MNVIICTVLSSMIVKPESSFFESLVICYFVVLLLFKVIILP